MNRRMSVLVVVQVIVLGMIALGIFSLLANQFDRASIIIANKTVSARQTAEYAAYLASLPPTSVSAKVNTPTMTKTPTPSKTSTPTNTSTIIPSPTLSFQAARPIPNWGTLVPSAPPNIAAGERVNILILGVDRRPNEKCPCRTDTMMIASLDPKNNSAALVTIPRDLWVTIPGLSEGRINEANVFGDIYRYPGGGAALAKQTVEQNLGRKIHYYARVDFVGFRNIVDALGGVDLEVPRAISDSSFPDYYYGYKPLYIPAGRVHMDGELALEYVRTRHQDSDFGRSRRQVQVLMAARDKALRLEVIAKLPALLQGLWGSVETDLKPQEILWLATAAARVKTENIRVAAIDGTMAYGFQTPQGADVLMPDREKISRLMNEIIPPDNPQVSTR